MAAELATFVHRIQSRPDRRSTTTSPARSRTALFRARKSEKQSRSTSRG